MTTAVDFEVSYLDINDDPLHVDAHEAGSNLEDAVRLERDEDEHDVLELGGGQALDSQQHSLHTSTGTAYSNSRAEESIYASREGERKREDGGGGG
jgi:hypothetical protein